MPTQQDLLLRCRWIVAKIMYNKLDNDIIKCYLFFIFEILYIFVNTST